MDTTFGRAPFEDPGRSYPCGPLAPRYLCGSYRLVPKVSMGSEAIPVRFDPFIIVHHRTKGLKGHTPVEL